MTSLIVEAENAVRAGRVKLYVFKPSGRRRWIVVGRHGEYLVLPDAGYCSCHDFFFRVMSGEKPTCYHLLAVKLARERNAYQLIEEDDRWHDTLMNEWLGRKSRPETREGRKQ
ncbi:MAG TPA: hypothetical protein ENG52_03720 [Nitrososphaeria archaeon]|nr:hypothetical protein [Nitrososphaeria archaeon]